MKSYKVKVTNIDACVEYEDVYDLVVEENPDVDEDSAKFEKLVEKKIKEIKKETPTELELGITCELEDLEDELSDAISDKIGWLHNGFDYDIISEEDYDDSHHELIFVGDDGDRMAEQYVQEYDIEDYEIERDNYEKGYRLSWSD